MEDGSEQIHPATFDSIPSRWSEQQPYPHSYHGTPAQEYTGFGWGSPPLPMHSAAFSQSPPLRPTHQQLQPLMMPWPSMIGSQQPFYPPLLPQTQLGTISPPTVTPVSAGSSNRSGPSVRKTLSDDDRRRMCKYAEENPTAKQTEIGYLFGVERSTVSKVLRKKEQYLNHARPKEIPRSPPNKRPKARLPDIEKTLSAWVIKEQKKGSPITDDAIREQAYYFASIPGPEQPALNPVDSPGWLEKFKQKHRINSRGTKDRGTRKDSVADSDNAHNNQSPTSPSDETLSSSSPDTIFPALDGTVNGDIKPSLSNKRRKSPPSIDTAFTDLGSTSTCFTPQLMSPTSPFFSPASQISSAGALHSPFLAQNFRAMDTFMADSPPSLSEQPLSPSHNHHSFLSGLSSITDDKERLGSIDECMEDISLLACNDGDADKQEDIKTINPDALKNEENNKQPTKQEAREALAVVAQFFETQPKGTLEVQEGMLLGILQQKLLR
ncbi:hypothetical protein QM012_006385 [Aureobasidium pullulans]|uniref:HTH CENPB-type domain-containing protein n=1 Tax=Aureobasidium pullulans TaxID=5580 RepID=A0ABR0TQ33_AURPU